VAAIAEIDHPRLCNACISTSSSRVSMRKRASFDWSCWRQTPAASKEARPQWRQATR
jgi:hypothetical protein